MEGKFRVPPKLEKNMAAAHHNDTGDRELTVITTHLNADFDALASMLAAQKLYPQALVVFPGSQEKNLRNFFVKSMVYLFNMADMKSIDLDRIGRLVLVDTRQPGRIGRFADILDRKGLKVDIYDHHPPQANDIRGDHEIIELTGATVTILTEIIQQRGTPVSPDEATIMCLGLYEDTGSFTFSSTTRRDFMAAAWLLERGANLDIVSTLIAREISPEQVALLNDMIQAAHRHLVNGIEIVITTVTTAGFVPDFAFLVHKMIRMENLNAIFGLALMENKVYVVGRSRIPEVNVGTIMAELGGGGHSFAAAGSIRGKTLVQVEHQLLEILRRQVQSRQRARDLMSSPAITVEAGVSCRHAGRILTRYNINALIATEKQPHGRRLAGFITRQVIEKALYHGLGDVPVREYMSTDLGAVGPGADLAAIQEKIIGNKQRILPVVDEDRICGVITRTDLLNVLVRQANAGDERPADEIQVSLDGRTRNVLHFMKERLPERLVQRLRSIGEMARSLGYRAYVVGGFVRDLFLYRKNEDIDIVIEGDGIAFARAFARQQGTRIHTHAKFGTAVIIYPDGFKIDVATARMEYYASPAALPTVEMSSIKLDLFRRDFTINTLAIEVTPDRFGTLIDFFSAQKDLKEKVIRVLHNLSFVEDPTRVFRAIRFEQRFGFTIGKLTAGLIENAVRMDFFKNLSGRRVLTELRLLLSEEDPAAPMEKLNTYDLLKVIHPALKWDAFMQARFEAVNKVLAWHDLLFLDETYNRWAVYFLALVGRLGLQTCGDVCRRLEMPAPDSRLFCRQRAAAAGCLLWLERNLPVKNSVIFRKLSPFPIELTLYMMAVTRRERVKRAISLYFTRLRGITISVSGKDIRMMGVPPGPIYRQILHDVLNARLDGELKTRQDELDFIARYVK
jgi:tRNA nucleotidyltransferase (CCA-adding enzyme)